jgi:glutathione synthase/RimK-type ligase-like ATP-grasp enzyme
VKKILILTREKDLHCDFVTNKIREQGGDTLRINTDKITSNLSYTFINHGQNVFLNSLLISDTELSFSTDSYDTIWYRKPIPVDVSPQYSNKEVSEFINSEYNIFLKEFYALNNQKKWVNDIWSINRAEFKLNNLNLAHNLGFIIPKTIVTNNPVDAENFAKSCNWNIIVKAFRAKGITHEEKPYVLYTNKVSSEEFEKFKTNIAICPTILQEYIEKQIELRVTVVNEEIFTAAIHSQENALTKLDFRVGNTLNLKHTVYHLPHKVSKALLEFNKYYNLCFSTFDIILTPRGEYVFLECNPNGQWYWIEELTELPISNAVAKLLIKGNNI